ncbi:flagellar basal body P-ring formation chaperone FlgA [Rhodoferax sp. AJA081-3]|uniref:flagellar basal body P-ring formation chaperone FlgA n=1 Tax=Rhodoferax sp. AJA081-3 TaxID=2752316 RepID=UPI001FD80A28|nr:flagellar basal body P-ring formation chaperone FlgA [Rhodoferax sp. AJA081-3]
MFSLLSQLRAVWLPVAAVSVLGLTMAANPALAQGASAPEVQAVAQDWLRDATAAAQPAGATALRMEVKLGNLDSRLKLAPCGNVEPYLPPGARLWGRTRVGLRCVDGMSRWNVSLPVTVNAYGNAWVIKGQVAAGSALTEDDVVEAEVNWAEENSPVVRDKALWVGQIATRALMTGQTLRQGMVRPAQVFQAGAQVRVVAQGAGFQVSAEGQALSAGVVGQVARVRMENGRVSSGTVLDTKTVKIDL